MATKWTFEILPTGELEFHGPTQPGNDVTSGEETTFPPIIVIKGLHKDDLPVTSTAVADLYSLKSVGLDGHGLYALRYRDVLSRSQISEDVNAAVRATLSGFDHDSSLYIATFDDDDEW